MMAAGLSGAEAEALVARRLAELGRDPRLVTDDAVAALRGCADSGDALRSVLTGALFLASTEDAPQVDASHVRRAAAMRPPERPAPAPGPPAAPRLLPAAAASATPRRAPAVAVLAALAAVLAAAPAAMLALHELHAPTPDGPAPPQPAVAPAAPAASVAPAAPAASVAPAAPAASVAPAAVTPLPTVASAEPSAPAAAPGPELVRTWPSLPEKVRQVVLLSYARGSPDAEARADALASALRARGISAAVVADAGLPAAASVSYFFADDRALAERVGAILGGAWLLNTKPLRATGRDLPQPGAIRVSVPTGG